MGQKFLICKSLILFLQLTAVIYFISALPTSTVQAADFSVNNAAALNNAIRDANNEIDNPGADTITLSADILLTGTLSSITSAINLNGNGYTLDGNTSYRVLEVANTGDLTINNLTISNGLVSNDGGAGILNSGTLTVNFSSLTNNSATTAFGGGGINNINGAVTINNSTFSENTADVGGGIRNSGVLSTLIINNSTFSSNFATFGGGVSNVNGGFLTITSSTFSGNLAESAGGGVRNDGTLHFSQTILANSLSGGDCSNTGNISTNSLNLIEDNSCSPAFSGDPNLDKLADNGGPTQTHALLSSSIAIDKVPSGGVDQRGALRNFDGDDSGDTGNEGDIGAYEYRETISVGDCAGTALEGQHTLLFTNGYSVTITVDISDGINCIAVEEMGTNHLMATGPGSSDNALLTGNWWHITANKNYGFNIDITLPFNSADENSRVCKWVNHYSGYGWDCGNDVDNVTGPTPGNVTRTNITSFSDWAVGDNVGPTVVTFSKIEAKTKQPFLFITAVIITALSLIFAIYRKLN